MTRIFVMPDVQAKPGSDFTYLRRIGQYVIDKKPEIIVAIGDWADMESLSSYDKGKKSYEGRRYKRDIEASKDAMCEFLTPMWDYNKRAIASKHKPYRPRMVMTLGNHEDRINRCVNESPNLDGFMSTDDLGFAHDGWEVHKFLEVVTIEGIAFSHYFTSGVMGRPVSTAQACLNKKHMSCVQGHQQGFQMATAYTANGKVITSLIVGSCYEHDEGYMGPQGNANHWRGCVMLNDVRDGEFEVMPLTLRYINSKYAHIQPVPELKAA